MVKWFDPVKGFGFVVADAGGADILLHVNVLRNYGQSSVADGARVAVRVQQTERGAQAVELLSVEAPSELPAAVVEFAGFDPEQLATAEFEPARVKWFDKAKGFGFANVFGCAEDVFLHIDVLRQSGLCDLQPGEALAMRVIVGDRGHLAAEVSSWDAVIDG
ncbi:cold shock domain-containing protein [Sulfitobacter sp. M85]|nr:cold shock domain-containing protein [Sulfitobacter sp. Ks11]MDF3386113.1 cold shock domain-containing protein [Sulfitobacter sp. M85]MDF3389532.1 cold shock domain-containing protein [Sulfitobacter sp. Ks16]MDF3400169.1 cold shock domain-containing protein [Sulfitobacter sp. KE39]MDF3403590.1 cold shock domain-containing protein [Sulfitobacter sp. Ks35]MDF3410668.1 cold shock domain-containing protein [Sulfitobacter sp. KE38]